MKRGRALEVLVAALEKALGHGENILIESPKRIRHLQTKRMREHDVVVTARSAHHTLLIAIECRDRKRPVGVDDVVLFHNKCLNTGIARPIIVSPAGFCASAIEQARILGVQCMDLTEATKFEWILPRGITVNTRVLKHTNWAFIPKSPLPEAFNAYRIVDEVGQEFNDQNLNAFLLQSIEKFPEHIRTQDIIRIKYPGEGITFEHRLTKAKHEIAEVRVEACFENKTELVPFEFFCYGVSNGEQVAEVAAAPLKIGQVSGKVIIAGRQDEAKRFMWVPDPPNKKN